MQLGTVTTVQNLKKRKKKKKKIKWLNKMALQMYSAKTLDVE